MFPPDIREKLRQVGAIAVLVVDDVQSAVPLAKALVRGGITAMELTLRTDAAIDALCAIREVVPEMLAGIGTILTTQQVDEVLAAGAAFGVSPGLNRQVVEHAQNKGLPFGPGIMTPSDIEQSIELGCTTLKFFPAESSGGIQHLISMAAPYQHLNLDFIPLGGVSPQNMSDYLSCPLVSAIGGSWIAHRSLIQSGDWNAIERNAKEAREIVDAINKTR